MNHRSVFDSINSIVIYVLMVAAVVSAVFREWAEVVLIILVIVCNSAIGLIQEVRSAPATLTPHHTSATTCVFVCVCVLLMCVR